MTRLHNALCDTCGREGETRLDVGYRCHPCRRANPRPPKPRPKTNRCLNCGEPCVIKYCSNRCSSIATSRRIRNGDDPRTRRRDRVRNAPGLTEYAIYKLSRTWRKQQRRCAYCDNPATTADHVLPLVRGGTNHEGNIAPCCKSCNSRKAGLTVIEWRTGRRLPQMDVTLDTMGRRKPKPKHKTPRPAKPTPPCQVCGAPCTGQRSVSCSEECQTKRNRDYMRNRYRREAGIPLDAELYRRKRPPVLSGAEPVKTRESLLIYL